MQTRQALYLTLFVSLGLCACGGRSPKVSSPTPARATETLGPKSGAASPSIGTDDLLSDESLAPFVSKRTLCSVEAHNKSLNLARTQLAAKEYEQALKTLQTLNGDCTEGRDDLLLIAATKDKLAQGRAQGALSSQDCADLLLSWQEYISFQATGNAPRKYLNRAISRANQLGERCGAWVSWRTEPSDARLFIQGHQLGTTPTELWLPAGELSYTAKVSTRQHQGKLTLKRGDEVSLNSPLTQIITPPHSIQASLLCDRPSSEEALKRCASSLKAGDRFRITVTAGAEPVYLYVMSVNERSVDLIYPSSRAVKLKAKTTTALPTDDAYQLDDQTKTDAVVIMTALERVELLQEQPSDAERKSGWERELRSFIGAARVVGTDEVTEPSDEQGWVMIRWNLKPSSDGPSPPTGDQS